jgi:hypothetical protein
MSTATTHTLSSASSGRRAVQLGLPLYVITALSMKRNKTNTVLLQQNKPKHVS